MSMACKDRSTWKKRVEQQAYVHEQLYEMKAKLEATEECRPGAFFAEQNP